MSRLYDRGRYGIVPLTQNSSFSNEHMRKILYHCCLAQTDRSQGKKYRTILCHRVPPSATDYSLQGQNKTKVRGVPPTVRHRLRVTAVCHRCVPLLRATVCHLAQTNRSQAKTKQKKRGVPSSVCHRLCGTACVSPLCATGVYYCCCVPPCATVWHRLFALTRLLNKY